MIRISPPHSSHTSGSISEIRPQPPSLGGGGLGHGDLLGTRRSRRSLALGRPFGPGNVGVAVPDVLDHFVERHLQCG
jgi:hypothetical protein